jgi:hypothetical protein
VKRVNRSEGIEESMQRPIENGGLSCSALGMMGFERSQGIVGWFRSQVPKPKKKNEVSESQLLLLQFLSKI